MMAAEATLGCASQIRRCSAAQAVGASGDAVIESKDAKIGAVAARIDALSCSTASERAECERQARGLGQGRPRAQEGGEEGWEANIRSWVSRAVGKAMGR